MLYNSTYIYIYIHILLYNSIYYDECKGHPRRAGGAHLLPGRRFLVDYNIYIYIYVYRYVYTRTRIHIYIYIHNYT